MTTSRNGSQQNWLMCGCLWGPLGGAQVPLPQDFARGYDGIKAKKWPYFHKVFPGIA